MDAKPKNLRRAITDLHKHGDRHKLKHDHKVALAWVIGKLLKEEKEDGD